jgi:hypothetical protein
MTRRLKKFIQHSQKRGKWEGGMHRIKSSSTRNPRKIRAKLKEHSSTQSKVPA